MSHAYLPSAGPICLSNRTVNHAQTRPRRSSEHHSNFLNPKRRNVQMGLLPHGLIRPVCRSKTKTIWAIVTWTIQSVGVFTVCYCLRRRDAKSHEGRGHLVTWAVPSLISVTVWLTATAFNGWKAFIPSAFVSSLTCRGVLPWAGVKRSWRVPWCFKPSVRFDFRHLSVPMWRMSVGQEKHKRSWHR